eukprot:scaffold38582_cov57-Attheya_sp.AAC.3
MTMYVIFAVAFLWIAHNESNAAPAFACHNHRLSRTREKIVTTKWGQLSLIPYHTHARSTRARKIIIASSMGAEDAFDFCVSIGKGSSLETKCLSFPWTLLVEGNLIGSIQCSKQGQEKTTTRVRVSEGGELSADVTCVHSVEVYGRVIGNIECQHLTVGRSGEVIGDVHVSSMRVDPGGTLLGIVRCGKVSRTSEGGEPSVTDKEAHISLNGQELPEPYKNGVTVISQPQIELELRNNEHYGHTDYNSAQIPLNGNTSPESYSNGAGAPGFNGNMSPASYSNGAAAPGFNGNTSPESYSNGAGAPEALQIQSDDSINHDKNGHTGPQYSNGASFVSPFRPTTHDAISKPEEYRGETEIPNVEPAIMPAEPSILRGSPSKPL